ncbi:MAG: DUF1841 family protein [Tepidanaerobacteraceae bacterium]|nr:DUF1841 family protein [Tepidanaerobacteraceae bacterium]
MSNKYLRESLLQVIDNQLRDNNPPCTKQTFERLVKTGYPQKRAKEMIAAVLIEEMFYIMKQNRPFDEESFCKKLNALS